LASGIVPDSANRPLADLCVLLPGLALILFILQILKTPPSEDFEDKKDAGSGMRARRSRIDAAQGSHPQGRKRLIRGHEIGSPL
jgi:hypothetical protein